MRRFGLAVAILAAGCGVGGESVLPDGAVVPGQCVDIPDVRRGVEAVRMNGSVQTIVGGAIACRRGAAADATTWECADAGAPGFAMVIAVHIALPPQRDQYLSLGQDFDIVSVTVPHHTMVGPWVGGLRLRYLARIGATPYDAFVPSGSACAAGDVTVTLTSARFDLYL